MTEKCDFCRANFDGSNSKKKARQHLLERHLASLRRTSELLPRPPSARVWMMHCLAPLLETVQEEERSVQRCNLSTDTSTPMLTDTVVVIDDSPPPSVVCEDERESEVTTLAEEDVSTPLLEMLDPMSVAYDSMVDDGIILRRILQDLEDVDLTPMEVERATVSSPVEHSLGTQMEGAMLVSRGRTETVQQTETVEARSGLTVQQMASIILWPSRLPSFPNWTRFCEEVNRKFPFCSIYDAEEINLQMQPWFIRTMASASVCHLPEVVPAAAVAPPVDDQLAVADWVHFNSAPASPEEDVPVLDGDGSRSSYSDGTDGLHTPSVEYCLVSSSAAMVDGEDDFSVVSPATSSEGYQPSSVNSSDTLAEASSPPLLTPEVETVSLSSDED